MKIYLLIIGISLAPFSFGQDSELSVGQAVEKALSNNYDIQLIRTNLAISSTQNTWGMAGMVPTFGIGIGNNVAVQDNTNNPATFFPGVVLNDNLNATLDMQWTVFSGFGIRINKMRFDQLEEQTKGNAVVVIENTIYNTIIAYYTAAAQERKLEILKEVLVFSNEKYNYFKMKEEVGVSTSLDLLEFRNQVLTDSSNYLLQELNHSNALRNLNLVMGEGVENRYKLTDGISIPISSTSFDELKNQMLSNNQSIKNQYINLELQELNKEAKEAAFYPVVSLSLATTPSVGYIEVFGDNGVSFSTNSWVHSAGVNVRYTLFNGYQRKNNLKIAEIQVDMAQLQIDQLELSLAHQLNGIFDLYQVQMKMETMAKERVSNAKRLFEVGKDKYDLGVINVFNLNDVKLVFEQSAISYYDRLLDLVKTHYDLMRISGQLTQEYKVVEKVNQE